jgi:hypothetical protein
MPRRGGSGNQERQNAPSGKKFWLSGIFSGATPHPRVDIFTEILYDKPEE